MAFRFNPLTGQLDITGSSSTPGSVPAVDTFTLTGTDITNKYVTLAGAPITPGDTILIVSGAGGLFFGLDFTVTGNQLGWNGLGLDGLLASGDQITISYIV